MGKLSGEERISFQHEVIQHCGVEFDCVKSFSSSENDDDKKALIVFLSGAAKRGDRTIPLFHRWSWQRFSQGIIIQLLSRIQR